MTDGIIQLGLLDDDQIPLDEAALALALLDNPETDLDPYRDILDDIATRLVEDGADTNRERAVLLAQVIAGEYGFTGDIDHYDDPANADLIRVIDRRCGLPVALAILYVTAARRAGWSAHVLDVPGHVLILVGDEVVPVIINPFKDGAAIGPGDLAALVTSGRRGAPATVQIAAMPNRALLVRLLLNQAKRAEQSGDVERAHDLFERITAFAPSYGGVWWERARLELIVGDTVSARASLVAVLETTRDLDVRARVKETLATLA
ncbi:transglutaminase-like domain-containing protein [Rhizorhabdus argentea]|uniref:transglutaminase-like domain-containing protein n=1 Tax=Rhizorhabdus argentea TaxID=1387174 RepID=UPI0030EE9A7D